LVELGREVATTEHPTQAHPAPVTRQPEPLMVTPSVYPKDKQMLYLAIIGGIILITRGFIGNNMIIVGGALLIIALMVSWWRAKCQ